MDPWRSAPCAEKIGEVSWLAFRNINLMAGLCGAAGGGQVVVVVMVLTRGGDAVVVTRWW